MTKNEAAEAYFMVRSEAKKISSTRCSPSDCGASKKNKNCDDQYLN